MSEAGSPAARVPRPRFAVLADLGIEVWLPRRQLPGAPEGVLWQRHSSGGSGRAAGGAPSAPDRAVPAVPAGKALQVARRLIAEPEARRPQSRPAESVPVRPSEPSAPEPGRVEQPVRLELHALRPGLHLLVVWPAQGPTAAQRGFIGDLIYAMNVVPEALPAPRVLDWQGNAPQSGKLRDAMAGFLAALPAGRLVAVGFEEAAAPRNSLPAGVSLLELPSVLRMTDQPGRKADAWKRLAHFLAPDGARS